MELKQCILTKNDCYKSGKKIKPTGIVVHSTGANNPYLRRYIAPDDGIIGKNQYDNDWNRPGIAKCVHAMIGKDKNGTVRIYQILPFDYRPWGCGSGTKGSYNDGYIQFEMLEDDLTDAKYFSTVYNLGIEFCAYLCKKYGISIDNIVSHKEAHAKGYASNHGDPENWLTKHSKNMNDFRKAVKAFGTSVSETKPAVAENVSTKYKVVNIKTTLNVRSSPNGTVTGSLKNGYIIEVTEIKDKWAKHSKGWSNLDYLQKVNTSASSGTSVKADLVYITAKGDTLSKIAVKYKTTAKKLADYNNIKDPNKISVGQKIKIPGV